MQSIFRDKVLWNEALTNLHTSWGVPCRHAPLPNSFVVRDDRGNRRKTLGGWSRGESLWSAYRVPEAARCLVILLPPLPSFPFYLPLHLTMTNPICSLSKATGYLSLFFPLLSYPVVLIPFVIYTASILVSSQGQGCRCQAWPLGS